MRGVPAVALIAVVLTGCFEKERNAVPWPARTVLENCATLEVLALDPVRTEGEDEAGFRGWRVRGKTAVADPTMRKWIVQNLIRGIVAEHGTAAVPPAPRHGLRATRDGDVVDVVICLATRTVTVYRAGAVATRPTDKLPGQLCDKVLFDAGIPPVVKRR